MESKPNFLVSLVSSLPRRIHNEPVRKNPFHEQLPPIKACHSNCDDETKVYRELCSILSKPVHTLPPIGRSFAKLKAPPRMKVNPIVEDEKFQELNSTAATWESTNDL